MLMSASATSNGLLVEVEDLHTYYGKSHILDGVSLKVGRGEVVGLLGRNGVGKSTTLKTIMGLINPARGKVLFEHKAITGMPAHRLARIGIAYVPEDRRIFRLLTVTENLRTGLDRRGVSEARKQELLGKVFAYFPVLAERRNQPGGTLSGGEQQMLALARALLMKPRLMLLDEPSLGLAPIVVRSIFQIIRAINETNRVAVLLVEQNARIALDLSSTAYVLEVGRVAVHGDSAELQGNESVRRSYLGY